MDAIGAHKGQWVVGVSLPLGNKDEKHEFMRAVKQEINEIEAGKAVAVRKVEETLNHCFCGV